MLKAIVKGGFAGLHKLADVDLLACHIEAFKREFPYEDIKVSSAEVSAEAPERLLTDEQRRVVIEALVDDTVAFIRKDVEYLQNLLREGRGGYQDMTDEALLIEHEDMIGRYEHDPRPETPKP
ncbi:hypothetical protein LJR168_003790 [Pseudoxanthomonas sp. LjRoot168]|uniref:hypothetical protein n=1 Tax=unclassified Pseudoxanthomonas TaxID=2645906 RepID=UPI003ECF85AA